MKITIKKPDLFKFCLDSLTKFSDEGLLYFTGDNLSLFTAHPSNVSFIVFNFDKLIYKVEDKKEDIILLSYKNIRDSIVNIGVNDILTIDINEKIIVSVLGTFKKVVEFGMLEEEWNKVTYRSLDKYTVNFNIPTTLLTDVLNNLINTKDDVNVVFEAVSNSFKINKEEKLIKSYYEFDKIKNNNNAKAIFSSLLLKLLLDPSKYMSECNIRFGDDFPLVLIYKKEKMLTIETILAPRAE